MIKRLFKTLTVAIAAVITVGSVLWIGQNFEQTPIKQTKVGFDNPDEYVKYHNAIRTKAGEQFPSYDNNYQFKALEIAQQTQRRSAIKSITWQERGPANVPGRTRAIIVDPDDPTQNTWFAGGASGGVWKTIDGGDNWEYISNGFPNLSISTMDMCEANTNVIYVGTGERGMSGISNLSGGGILKTTDKGFTWTLFDTTTVPDLRTVNRLVVDPADENTVIACVVSANYHPTNQNGEDITSSIIKTVDGGATWEVKYSEVIEYQNSGNVQHIVADPNNFNVLYASVMGMGVMKSIDKGETWTLYDAGFTGDFRRVELAIAQNNTDILYASVEGDATGNNSDFYISQDAGESWQLVLEQSGSAPDWLVAQGWYDNTILSNPFNDSVVYVGGINLWRITLHEVGTGNVTRTTEHITDSYYAIDGKNSNVHVDHHNITAIPGQNGEFRIINGNDGGLFLSNLSTDPGFANNTWVTVGHGYNTTQFYGVDKAHGVNLFIGGTQDNGTWGYMNPGSEADETSDYQPLMGGDGFEAIWHYDDPDKLMASSQFNGIFATTDGGNNGAPASDGLEGEGPFITRLASSKSDNDVIYAVTSLGVGRTDNFGANWEMTYIDEPAFGFWSGMDVNVSIANPQNVMVGGRMDGTSHIHVSTDGGLTFTPCNDFDALGYVTGISSHPTLDSTFFATFSIQNNAKVLRTDDLGQTWTDISGYSESSTSTGFPDVAVYDVLVMPYNTDIIWVATEIGIFESIDEGASWNLVAGDFPAVSVWDMKIVDGMVVLGTFGRGIWTAAIPELDTYEYPDIVRVPRINSISQAVKMKSTNLVAEVELRDAYDSVQIMLNDTYAATIPANASPETINYEFTTDLTNEVEMQLIAWADGEDYFSSKKSTVIIVFGEAVLAYENDFNSATSDFIGSGFEISTQTGFIDGAIHSVHPYADMQNYTMMLNVPIAIQGYSVLMDYKDVAVVEPGEPGSNYGDSDFWDYVIVEGSTDGVNWQELIDGYDARESTAWVNAYNSADPGTSDMFVTQQIELRNTFNVGDTVLIRFRLYTDEAVNSWGWTIDDLNIQNIGIGVENNALSMDNVNIYPNPNKGVFKMQVKDALQGTIDVKIVSIDGRLVYQKQYNNAPNATLKIDITDMPTGVYIAHISDGNSHVSKKIQVQK
ncbi:MAG: hypothetical protein C0599_09325 [Salinivirgaceae bacterium]|nr:MAG: hypothetical protein C0599_09325 [Salinivirgaceae bacterium]